MIKVSAKNHVDEANTEIETLSVEDAIALHGDENTVLGDIRDVR